MKSIGRAALSEPFYCLLYFDLTCLPYLSWIRLRPVTVLPPGVGIGYNNYFVQRLSGPTDFRTIQPRHWHKASLTSRVFTLLVFFCLFSSVIIRCHLLPRDFGLDPFWGQTFAPRVWTIWLKYFNHCSQSPFIFPPLFHDVLSPIRPFWIYSAAATTMPRDIPSHLVAHLQLPYMWHHLWWLRCLLEQQQVIIMSEQTQLKGIKVCLTGPKFCLTAFKVSPFSSVCDLVELLVSQQRYACNTISRLSVIRSNQQWTEDEWVNEWTDKWKHC